MPTRLSYILDRLPLPSLRIYTLFSISLLFANVFYYHHLIQSNRLNFFNENSTTNISTTPILSVDYFQTLFVTVISQSLSLLILINAIYCSLTLIGKQIQTRIFNDLRLIEIQRLKEKFWNYAFYKFCFLFGVLGLENLNELVLWISWFSVLAFILIFCQLAKDRFELLSISASVRRQSFVKVLGLLSSLFVLCLVLFVVCFTIGLSYGGLSIFFFMFAEIVLLSLDTCYLLVKYFLQYSLFIQQEQDPTRSLSSNETRSSMIYYFEFLFHISTLTIDILHHLQMLFYHQTFMSMSSLIFFMQLKPLFHELTQRLKKHKSYRMAMLKMEKKYPLLTKYDLEQKYLKQNHRSTLEEVCSICWEKFDKARCLPCGHLFHQNCLQSWLEQDTTCPICRLSLHEENSTTTTTTTVPTPVVQNNFLHWPQITLARLATNVHEVAGGNPTTTRRPRNHLFRFDGHRYSSWLPSFSIEINHNFPFRLGRSRLTGIQLTSLTQNIQQIFPQIPAELILADLQQTQSMDATINNIIDRRIRFDPTAVHQQQNDGQDVEGSEDSSYTSTSASSSDIEDILDVEPITENRRKTTAEDDEPMHSDNFTWPLNPNLSFAERKQKLILHMRRRFLENEQRSQISRQKTDLLNES